MRKIAVLGGGNGARTVAADMTLAGHKTVLYEMPEFRENIKTIFETGTICITGKARTGEARLFKVTHAIEEAVKDVELILIVVPAYAHASYAKLLGPVLKNGHNIVLIPGTMGF